MPRLLHHISARYLSMLRGSVFTHSLLGKVLDLAISYPKDQTAPPSRHAKPAFSAPARLRTTQKLIQH